MVVKRYIPQKGDFLALTFDPQSGHEQRGRRPALVVSNELFNRHTGLALVCPVTTRNRRIPFHIEIPEGGSVTGHVMADQVKSIDYATRNARFIEKAPERLLNEVLAILDAIIY